MLTPKGFRVMQSLSCLLLTRNLAFSQSQKVPSTGPDWENAAGNCYTNTSTGDYDFSDVVNNTPESICEDPTDPKFDPGTAEWDDADVEPRDQITNSTPIPTGFIYFCNWIETEGRTVKFGGNSYAPLPYKAEGFQIRNEGVPPNPSITIANIGLEMTSLINSYDDLLGLSSVPQTCFSAAP